jgi:hypothetical protein
MSRKTLIITVLVIAILAVAGVATYIVQQRQDKGAERLVDEFYETLKPYIRDSSIRAPVTVAHDFRSDFVIDVKRLTPEVIDLAKSNFLAQQDCPSRIHFSRIWFDPFILEGYDPKTGEWVKNPSYIYLPPEQEVLFLELSKALWREGEVPNYVFAFDEIGNEVDFKYKIYHAIFKYYHKDGKEELTLGVVELGLGVSQGGPCE